MNREDYLNNARDIICNQRPGIHGTAENAFSLVADYWSVFLSKQSNVEVCISAADVAMMLALFKTARWQMNPNHADNVLDGIGYLALAGELQDNTEWPMSNKI
ncbi:MAG: Ruegeria phage vB RpoS-V16 [Pseudomonadota bacterium]|jgi:hypothetical protein